MICESYFNAHDSDEGTEVRCLNHLHSFTFIFFLSSGMKQMTRIRTDRKRKFEIDT